MGMSKSAWVLLVALVLGVLLGFMAYKDRERNRISREAKEDAYALVDSRLGLAGEEAYVRELIDEFHDTAFTVAFESGDFAAQSLFDEEIYLDELWTRVAQRAREDGRPEIASALPHLPHHREELEQQRRDRSPSPAGDGAT